MARPFKELRDAMHRCELTNEALAREIGCGTATISVKLNAHYPWTSEEMWKIMELIGEPDHRLHQFFPRDGQNEPGAKRGKRSA